MKQFFKKGRIEVLVKENIIKVGFKIIKEIWKWTNHCMWTYTTFYRNTFLNILKIEITWKVKVLVTQSCPTLWSHGQYVAFQAPLSTEFSRQEYWSELPCPFPGNLPDPGIELRSPVLQADSIPSEPPETT